MMIALPDTISVENAETWPVYCVRHPAAAARVALHGAHLMEWTPAGARPVLYTSPAAVFREGKAIRGGIPVCWPWFGPDPSGKGRPAHGFARTRAWVLAAAGSDADGVRLEFSLAPSAETRAVWPHEFTLRLVMEIGETLRLTLTAGNACAEPLRLTAALHTYFSIADIHQAEVRGLEDAAWVDATVEPHAERLAEQRPVRFAGEVDRVYASGAPVTIHDTAAGRIIRLVSTGSRSCVVWNPWIGKAEALSDLPDDDYQRFVCVETTNAGDDVIFLAPGASHSLGMEVTVGPE